MRAVFALMCLALPASAQEGPATFSLPAGCEAYLTVQRESCEVLHHFTCAADPEGHQRKVALDEQGATYLGQIDREAQWIFSTDPRDGERETLQPSPLDPQSLTELLSTGVDSYDFRTFSTVDGAFHYIGSDRLTGETTVIDGISLNDVIAEIKVFDLWERELFSVISNEYVSPDWRIFLGGQRKAVVQGRVLEESRRPVEFIFPGEPGFLSSRPKYGCGVALS